MHHATRPARRNLRGLVAAALATLWLGAAAQSQSPSAHELEVWRAAHGIGTAAAYQAYLDGFPQGAFAALARAAIGKVQGADGAAPAVAAKTPSLPSAVAALSGDLDTSAANVALGDRLNGPGLLTLGGFGNRRQLVLPAGEWIVLDGFDHRSADRQPVTMSTLAFGQFVGAQLRSLLVVSFNSRTVATPSGGQSIYLAQGVLPAWPQATACEQAAAGELSRDIFKTRFSQACARLDATPAAGEALARWDGLADRLGTVLNRLQARSPGFNLRSEVQMTDQRFNYQGYLRLDCLGDAAEGARCGAAPRAAAETRVAWLKTFAPLALAGMERQIDGEDLRPGAPAQTPAPVALPD